MGLIGERIRHEREDLLAWSAIATGEEPSQASSWEYNEAVLSTGKRWFYGSSDHWVTRLFQEQIFQLNSS